MRNKNPFLIWSPAYIPEPHVSGPVDVQEEPAGHEMQVVAPDAEYSPEAHATGAIVVDAQ